MKLRKGMKVRDADPYYLGEIRDYTITHTRSRKTAHEEYNRRIGYDQIIIRPAPRPPLRET